METQTVGRPLGEVLAANLRRIRDHRRLTVRALSGLLGGLGRPMLPSGLTKIEQRGRQVSVEDLVALALALNVSPTYLLTPPEGEWVQLTPTERASAFHLDGWLSGGFPLPAGANAEAFMELAPDHKRAEERAFRHPALMALTALRVLARDAVLAGQAGEKPAATAKGLREQAALVVRYVELLAGEVELGGNRRRGVS